MNRLIHIATKRRKDLLLYTLMDVLPFYEHFGFHYSSKCFCINLDTQKPWHFGRFITLEIR